MASSPADAAHRATDASGPGRLAALSRDLMGALDADGRFAWVNPAWERLLGWSEDVLRRHRHVDLLHPDDVPAARAAERRLRLDGDLAEVELRVRTRAGGHRCILFAATLAREDGLVYVSGKDVTDRVAVEAGLRVAARDAEDRFAEAFEHAAVGMALLTPACGFLRANRALCDLLGLDEGALLRSDLAAVTHPADRGADGAAIDAMLAGRTRRLAIERRVVRAGGDVVLVRINLALVRDDADRPVHLVAQIEDVTERRRMLEALALSQARYRALISHIPDSIVTLFDAELRVLMMDGPRLTAGGHHPDDFVGRSVADTVIGIRAPDELLAAHRAALGGAPQSVAVEHATGARFRVQVVPLRDDAGRTIGGVAVARDVTELEEHARELERSNEELQQFAAIASHDLSAPLRMVAGHLQLLRRRYGDGRLGADADELIDHAVGGADRMRALIDDLLAYSRAGRRERPADAVDLEPLMGDVAATVRAAAPEADIAWTALPTVRGDAAALSQLLQNVVGNAAKFARPGEPARVRVAARHADEAWEIAVEDDGIGIDPADAERVFGMFQRLHTADEFPGTGIGLAIARKVVERHGGRIWAEPGDGGGARFAFTLPAA